MCRPTLDNLNIHLFTGNNQLPQDTLNIHTKVHDVTCIKNMIQVLSMIVVDFVIVSSLQVCCFNISRSSLNYQLIGKEL